MKILQLAQITRLHAWRNDMICQTCFMKK